MIVVQNQVRRSAYNGFSGQSVKAPTRMFDYSKPIGMFVTEMADPYGQG
jgi:hypothetical protein